MIERPCPICHKFSKRLGAGTCEHCGYTPTLAERALPVVVGLVGLAAVAWWIFTV